eukprot:TRINITY_DN28_c0_g1_i3.p1 TRINITY_DN28_c0_g1~~TRINITY_DN28_c0_g1_i3.p1  ORF type:complete len:348 (+),score=155.09 TRINITY_DN28_c0_g1_i3:54-1046(+)
MIKSILIVAMLAAVALARPEREYRAAFMKFMKDNGKTYAQSEFSVRYNVFRSNMDFVDAWNAQDFHKVAINRFADLTVAEFAQLFNGISYMHNATYQYVPSVTTDTVNWVTKGAVTGVKDQGQCGSCWSFSVAQAIEGTYAVTTGQLASLSEQQIIDCSWVSPYNNTGCDGGDTRSAMQYVIDAKGLEADSIYPYVDYNGGNKHPCKYNAPQHFANITGMYGTIFGNETDLTIATLSAPVSVAIDANHDSFQFYGGGIYYERKCGNNLDDLDHGVLVVGYAPEYWIVKNSWGTDWGMDGYIWMTRDSTSTKWPWKNNCGIASYATLALLN